METRYIIQDLFTLGYWCEQQQEFKGPIFATQYELYSNAVNALSNLKIPKGHFIRIEKVFYII